MPTKATVTDRMEGYDRDVAELRDNAMDELRRHGRGGQSVRGAGCGVDLAAIDNPAPAQALDSLAPAFWDEP